MSAMDKPQPEQIVERLTDVPDDTQVEQEAAAAAKAEKADEKADEKAEDEQLDAVADEAKPEQVKKPKSASERQGELRARIAAETKAYHDARRAREFEQSELVRLRRERDELTQKSKEAAPAADKPVWAKFEEAGKSYEEFLDARAEFDRKQTLELTTQAMKRQEDEAQERARVAQQTTAQQLAADAHTKRVNAAAQKHTDFFEVVQQNLQDVEASPFLEHVIQNHDQGAELLYHLAKNPDEARILSTLSPSRAIGDAIRYSDMPIELLSHLSQHPQELDRLNQLHPASALVALGEIKAQLKGAKDGSPATEVVSNAKPPIRPVGGGRTSAPKSSEDLPFGPDWIREENKRDRERKTRSAYI